MEYDMHLAQGAVDRAMPTVDTHIYPRGGLDVLSRQEVARLRDASAGGLHDLLRRCALAVLTSGSASDDPRAAQELYPDFDIQVEQHDRGLRLVLRSAPATRTGSCAGAATRSTATSTPTPRRSATSSACAAWTSAPAAVPAP